MGSILRPDLFGMMKKLKIANLLLIILATSFGLCGCATLNKPETDIQRNQAKIDAIDGFHRFCASYGKNAEVIDLDDGVGDLKFRFTCIKK